MLCDPKLGCGPNRTLSQKVGKAEDVLPKLLEEIFGENQWCFSRK
jgi:hypothetical protein